MNNDRIVWTDDSSCFTRKNSPSCNTYLGASRQSMPKKLLYSHSREAMQFLNTVANHKRFIILPHFSSLLFWQFSKEFLVKRPHSVMMLATLFFPFSSTFLWVSEHGWAKMIHWLRLSGEQRINYCHKAERSGRWRVSKGARDCLVC